VATAQYFSSHLRIHNGNTNEVEHHAKVKELGMAITAPMDMFLSMGLHVMDVSALSLRIGLADCMSVRGTL